VSPIELTGKGGVWWGMARRPTPHLWVAMLLVVAGLGFGGGAVASATEPTTADRPAAVALTPTVIDVAVVPARIDARPRAVGQSAYGRSLLPLVALLLTLAGLIGSTAGRSVAPVVGHAPLLSRRHAIALRAPPSLQFGLTSPS